ncbi:MAG: acyl-ACP--UDP-N-acetylglucosamine O-acyltransferase [Acidobacteriota bacterium]
MNIPHLLTRLNHRYPALLVDAIGDFEPGKRLTAFKNVTVNEEFFQGHFPGTPVMPGVLMIEALTQVTTILLFQQESAAPFERAVLRGVDNAKFRKQVVPGDRLELEVTLGARRGRVVRAKGVGRVAGQVVAEAEIVIGFETLAARSARGPIVHETAVVHPNAKIGKGTIIGPFAMIGEHVVIGERNKIGASAVIDGWTTIGDENEMFPFASIGLQPQDLKYAGEPTRLTVGNRNCIREFVTLHRGTAGGGGLTTVGDQNLFMAYAHVAHDCHVGNQTIFGNAATLGGHVEVEDFVTISAYSGVHQFCRIGKYAFIGGYTVVTRDALPYAKTVGNRARIYGLNSIGLERRGFSRDLLSKLRKAYRHLIRHNTSRAIELIEKDPSLAAPEVQYLVDFIRTAAKRGVILRRPSKKADGDEE